jgi:hypothetical protein
MGFLAVFLGLLSQAYYLLMMGPLTLGWLFLDRTVLCISCIFDFPAWALCFR